MASDHLRDTTLVRAATDLLSDLSDLVRKELYLARAEMSQALAQRVQAAAWMGVAALLALIVLVLLVEAAVFALASTGLATHWACLIVAAALAVAALIAFAVGRSSLSDPLTPTRTARQLNETIRTATEQLR
jgi:Na+/melibiose symporter-like transporter